MSPSRAPRVATLKPSVATANVSPVRTLGTSTTGQPSDRADSNRMTSRPWRRLREQVLMRDRYLCQCTECKAQGLVKPADEVDHVVPLAFGGTNDPANLQAINRECHARKSRAEAVC